MTHLLDLPNELLLMVAVALDSKSRRRFSKTCQRCFILIRSQRSQDPKKWQYEVRDRFSQLKIRQLSGQECILRFGAYEHHESRPRLVSGDRDDRIFCVVNGDASASADMEGYLSANCTIPRNRVLWIRSADVAAKLSEIVAEAMNYVCVFEIIYEVKFGVFSRELAEWIIRKMKTTCVFMVLNDGFYSEAVHVVVDSILKMYLDVATTPEAARKRDWRSLKIFDRFTRKCCPNVGDEDERVDDSSRRLMEQLRGRRTKGGGEYVPQWYGLANSTGRWLNLAFYHQDIVAANLNMERDRTPRLRCRDYYQQLPVPECWAIYNRELAHMQRDIEETNDLVLKLQNKVEQHRRLLQRMELDPSHVQRSEVLPEMIMKWQALSLKLQHMRNVADLYRQRHELWSIGTHTSHSM